MPSGWDTLFTSNTALFPQTAGIKRLDVTTIVPNFWDKLVTAVKSGMLDDLNMGGHNLLNVGSIQTVSRPAVLALLHAPITLTTSVYYSGGPGVGGIPWDNNSTGMAYNVGGMHSTSVNPSRFTAQVAGLYMIGGVLATVSNAAGQRIVQLNKNGGLLCYVLANAAGGGNGNYFPFQSFPVKLAIGDYIEFQPWQNTGGNLATIADLTLGFMYLIG